jgi:hypothetical protein
MRFDGSCVAIEIANTTMTMRQKRENITDDYNLAIS